MTKHKRITDENLPETEAIYITVGEQLFPESNRQWGNQFWITGEENDYRNFTDFLGMAGEVDTAFVGSDDTDISQAIASVIQSYCTFKNSFKHD